MRKKNNQVSFLHLYHHVSMVGISWGGTRYMPGTNSLNIIHQNKSCSPIYRNKSKKKIFLNNWSSFSCAHKRKSEIFMWNGSVGGHGTMLGLLNSFVHVVMYAYYCLSAFGPHMQKYLWWKRYLTRMQMVCRLPIYISPSLERVPTTLRPSILD